MSEEIIDNKFVLTRYKRMGQYFTEHLCEGINLDMVLIFQGEIIMRDPGDELTERFLQTTIPDVFNYFSPRQRDIMRMRDNGDNGPPITLEELSYIINFYPNLSRNKKAVMLYALKNKYFPTSIPINIPQFFMGKYAITQAQWRVVAGYETIERKLKPEPAHFKGDNRPVEQVNWDDAREFCNRLSVKTGRTYRLPTEVEWEYACRAGTETLFHFGETISDELANYNATEIYGRGIKGKFRQETTDVGSFPPNNFGLYDMHGNVWEWCEDDWHDNYKGVPNDGTAWIEENRAETNRLVRGGSWFNVPRTCRSAGRFNYLRQACNNGLGFRVVCESPIAQPSPS